MTESEIERLLTLQKSAYEMLLWLNERGYHDPEVLNDATIEKWRFIPSCEIWVNDVWGMLPAHLRPAREDIPAFARLFSSFFTTSFRVMDGPPVPRTNNLGDPAGWKPGKNRQIVPGSSEAKKSRAGKEKVIDLTHELRIFALEELAIENDIELSRADLEILERNPTLDADLTLWTYIHQLNRRAQFASQGEAIHKLWRAMDKKDREKMRADKVLKAREALLTAIAKTKD